jgi:hypothetical protein
LGNPSLNISVPLNVAGCDDVGTCFAIGTTGLDIAPNAAAQASTNNKSWHAVKTPNSPSTLMDAIGCWHGGCLFGGSNPSGDVIWKAGTPQLMTEAHAPSQGRGIVALTCFNSGHCAAIDTDANGKSRLSFSDNQGASWSSPTAIGWSADASALSLSCSDDSTCVVAGTIKVTGGSAAIWALTSDGGASWATAQNAQWIQLTDLTCSGSSCDALASTSNGLGVIVHSRDGGATWNPDTVQPSKSPGTLACSSSLRCVVVSDSTAWIAARSAGKWTARSLKYVPDAFIDAGCGANYCVAIDSQTTLIIKL